MRDSIFTVFVVNEEELVPVMCLEYVLDELVMCFLEKRDVRCQRVPRFLRFPCLS